MTTDTVTAILLEIRRVQSMQNNPASTAVLKMFQSNQDPTSDTPISSQLTYTTYEPYKRARDPEQNPADTRLHNHTHGQTFTVPIGQYTPERPIELDCETRTVT